MAWPWPLVLLLIGGVCGESKHKIKFQILTVHRYKSARTVSVMEDGSVMALSDTPTLYSLFRERIFPARNESGFTFMLEAVAANRRICMDDRGVVYSTELRKRGGFRRQSPPKAHCLFRSAPAKAGSYNSGSIIYSVGHSNKTMGRFLAFNRSGFPRPLRRSLSLFNYKEGLVIDFVEANETRVRNLVNNTTFFNGQTVKLNNHVRKCMKNRLNLFAKLRHSRDLYRKIVKCKTKVGKRFPGRKVMKTDSRQRSP